jgi:hypothetical protein
VFDLRSILVVEMPRLRPWALARGDLAPLVGPQSRRFSIENPAL